MEDREIIERYWNRDESAIVESRNKYGGYCTTIAYNILSSIEDTDECVADTFFQAWNAIPPTRPDSLKLFLGRITRNLSLSRLRQQSREKRGGGQADLALDELLDCVANNSDPFSELEEKRLSETISDFLSALPPEKRKVFVLRYWYLYSIREISQQTGAREGKIKSTLHRTRRLLRQHLEKEGFTL